ncbi:MAG: DUF1501 domain-containing protein [Planctomycetales bacterium]
MSSSPFATWAINRRAFLGNVSTGIGSAVLASMLNADLARGASTENSDRWTGVLRKLHHPPKAKRIVFLCMAGGPSHLETFDPKPKLAEMNGQPMPESYTKGKPIAQLQGAKLNCLAPQFEFKKFGESGQEIAGPFSEIGSIADDICIVRSLVTEAINHDPAHTFMNTGTTISGRPAMGSWINYGLGSENDSLPGFVVLTSVGKTGQQPVAVRQWNNGFLPSRFQGVEFRSKGEPVLYVRNPDGVGPEKQRDVVDAVNELNRVRNSGIDDPEVAARVAAYETAFRMQSSAPELIDVSGEPSHVLDMYGTQGADGSFAGNCLLARRLLERGVRFVQLYHRGWDHHSGVKKNVGVVAGEVDRASAALVRDLKQRDMLKDTLVIWGGEFGRTPMAQGDGRDHHIKGFSIWLAGGGIKGGLTHGATDELGYDAVENVVHVHDLHATVLHLLGIDHTRLTYRFQGRDFRLTDVAGNVVREVLI